MADPLIPNVPDAVTAVAGGTGALGLLMYLWRWLKDMRTSDKSTAPVASVNEMMLAGWRESQERADRFAKERNEALALAAKFEVKLSAVQAEIDELRGMKAEIEQRCQRLSAENERLERLLAERDATILDLRNQITQINQSRFSAEDF